MGLLLVLAEVVVKSDSIVTGLNILILVAFAVFLQILRWLLGTVAYFHGVDAGSVPRLHDKPLRRSHGTTGSRRLRLSNLSHYLLVLGFFETAGFGILLLITIAAFIACIGSFHALAGVTRNAFELRLAGKCYVWIIVHFLNV